MRILHHLSSIPTLSWMLACLLMLAGCMQKDYDLSSVDTTIGVGSDSLQLPASSVRDILNDLLGSGTSSCIVIEDNGDYAFQTESKELKTSEPNVDKITIIERASTAYRLKVSLPDMSSTPSANGTQRIPIAQQTVSGTIKLFNFDGAAENVTELDWADVDSEIDVNIWFNDDLQQIIPKFNSFTITLPLFLKLDIETYYTSDRKRQRVMFYNVNTSQPVHLHARIERLRDFTTTMPEGDDDYLVCYNEQANLKAEVRVEATFNAVNPTAGNPNNCYIESGVSMDKFVIEKARGRFCPTVDLGDVGDTRIESLPAFLKDEETRIKLANPRIMLTVANGSDYPLKLSKATFRSYESLDAVPNETLPMGKVEIGSAPLLTSDTTKIIICAYEDDDIRALKAADTARTQILVNPDMTTLLDKVPRLFNINVQAAVDDSQWLELTLGEDQGYKIEPSFNLTAPLQIKDGTLVLYHDTLTNLNDDLNGSKVALREGAYLEVTADVYNETGLEVASVSATPLSVNKGSLASKLSVQTTTNDSSGNNHIPGLGKTTQLRILIQENEQNAIRQLDKIAFAFRMVPTSDGVRLNRNTVLVMKNIKVCLKGKLSMSL